MQRMSGRRIVLCECLALVTIDGDNLVLYRNSAAIWSDTFRVTIFRNHTTTDRMQIQ